MTALVADGRGRAEAPSRVRGGASAGVGTVERSFLASARALPAADAASEDAQQVGNDPFPSRRSRYFAMPCTSALPIRAGEVDSSWKTFGTTGNSFVCESIGKVIRAVKSFVACFWNSFSRC